MTTAADRPVDIGAALLESEAMEHFFIQHRYVLKFHL